MGAGWGLERLWAFFRRFQDTGEQWMSHGRNTGADLNGIKQNLIKLKTEKDNRHSRLWRPGLQNCREPGGSRADRK